MFSPVFVRKVWGHWPHDLASISAWHLGMREISVEQAKLAVEKTPDDPRLQANLKFVSAVADVEEKQKAA